MSELRADILNTLQKGENLTDSDVKKINVSFDELQNNGDLDFDELEQLEAFMHRVIGQVSVEPDSKLSPDGST